jgi:beta-lactamase regulating signal transducer with metallopeptidase domain
MPARLRAQAEPLALARQISYLALSAPLACCYGYFQPRIALTAGLLDRLNEEELTAVLLHERHHLRRRDPLRYLALRAVAQGLFMVPLVPVVCRRAEVALELAADRAALAFVSRGALAGALSAALLPAQPLAVAVAALSPTEERIAHLAGWPAPRTRPVATLLATFGLIAALSVALHSLATPHQIWELVCAVCPALD